MKTIVFLTLLLSSLVFAIPAFPDAEGFGSNTAGGRGGQVLIVSNLNDSGPGSLREAATTTSPRIIVFNISGIIFLNNTLTIDDPYITIAGQTSPGGVLIAGSTVVFNTHDVIVQDIRFRVGTENINFQRYPNGEIVYYTKSMLDGYSECPDYNDPDPYILSDYENGYPCDLHNGSVVADYLDNVVVLGKGWAPYEAYNLIFDHCSFSWGIDETFTLTGGVMNATVQWSIISEGLDRAGHTTADGEGHSKGLMLSGKPRYNQTISIHHNYIASNKDRSPMLFCPYDIENTCVYDGVNNVIYNWYHGLAPWLEETSYVNWISNYAKEGPESSPSREIHIYERSAVVEQELLYLYGNIGASATPRNESWNVGTGYYSTIISDVWQKQTPWDVPSITTTNMSYQYALQILETVGATKPLRDSIDTRVVNDFDSGTGSIINNVKYPDDYPTYEELEPAADTDRDGMADSWETARGLTVGVDDSSGDDDSDGYTNIEEYLHYLAADDIYNDADSNEDNMINSTEIRAYVRLWKSGVTEISNLFSAMTIWKSGGSY